MSSDREPTGVDYSLSSVNHSSSSSSFIYTTSAQFKGLKVNQIVPIKQLSNESRFSMRNKYLNFWLHQTH